MTITRYRCDLRPDELHPWRLGTLTDEETARKEASRAREAGGLVRLVRVEPIPSMPVEADIELDRRPVLFFSPLHPNQWITAENGGPLVIWPVQTNGWVQRAPFGGSSTALIKMLLVQVPITNAYGTGWPEIRSATDVALADEAWRNAEPCRACKDQPLKPGERCRACSRSGG